LLFLTSPISRSTSAQNAGSALLLPLLHTPICPHTLALAAWQPNLWICPQKSEPCLMFAPPLHYRLAAFFLRMRYSKAVQAKPLQPASLYIKTEANTTRLQFRGVALSPLRPGSRLKLTRAQDADVQQDLPSPIPSPFPYLEGYEYRRLYMSASRPPRRPPRPSFSHRSGQARVQVHAFKNTWNLNLSVVPGQRKPI
jgi:hypothetical protein